MLIIGPSISLLITAIKYKITVGLYFDGPYILLKAMDILLMEVDLNTPLKN